MFLPGYWSGQNTAISLWQSSAALANLILLLVAYKNSRLAAFYYSMIGVVISWFPVFCVLPVLPWTNIVMILAALYVWDRSELRCETTETVLVAVLPALLYCASMTANLMYFS
jgi:hypothetical protein